MASLGATTGAKDWSAHPKQQPRQARPPTSRGQWRGVRPLMKPTPPRQGRNITLKKPGHKFDRYENTGKKQSTTSSMASVPNICVCAIPHLLPMRLVTPSKEVPVGTVFIFSYGASCSHPVPFPGCHSGGGLVIPEEPLGGLSHISTMSTQCVLLARWGSSCCPAGPNALQRPRGMSSPSASVYPVVLPLWTLAIRALSGGASGGSVATISFGIGIRALIRPSCTPEFFFVG